MVTPIITGSNLVQNETESDSVTSELQEECDVDCENFPLVVDLQEYARRKVYDEFWGDLCWVEPEPEKE